MFIGESLNIWFLYSNLDSTEVFFFSLFKRKSKRAKARPKIYYLNWGHRIFLKDCCCFFQDGNDPNNFEPILDQYGHLLRGGDLMVHNVQAEDAGIYFCFAKTNSGTVFQKAVLEFVPLCKANSL